MLEVCIKTQDYIGDSIQNIDHLSAHQKNYSNTLTIINSLKIIYFVTKAIKISETKIHIEL